MAITGLGNLCSPVLDKACLTKPSKKELPDIHAKREMKLQAADLLLGIAAIVFGILTMLNIIPLPSGVGQMVSMIALGAGVVNVIASLKKGLCCPVKTIQDCKGDGYETIGN